MKKHWWIVLVLVFALAIPAMANQAVKVVINGQELKTDVPAQNIDGRVLVPLRAISEYFGKDVAWDPETKTATITGDDALGVVEKISAQWEESPHANTNRPLSYAGPRDGCQPCHSGNGFSRYFTDDPFTPQADAEAGLDAADIDVPAQIGCSTCHSGLGKELIDTGIAKAELVPFADEDFEAKNSALCISCHNGRRDIQDFFEQWSTGSGKPVDYPHHGGNSLYLSAGAEYPDGEYRNSVAHQNIGCTTCHMPKTEEGFASHKFYFDEASVGQTCGTCHSGATDLSFANNLRAELAEMLEELHEAAVAAVPGAAKIGSSRTEFPFADAEGNRVDLENVSLEAWVAAYNYYAIKDDLENFSGGVHNPQYAKSLIRESLKRLQ